MLEVLIIIGLSALVLSSTEDKNKSSPKETNTYNNNNEKIHNLKLKTENMTTYELDRWLKENNWDFEYGSYSREYKVNKIVELLKDK